MKNILISGGTGLIGTHLGQRLEEKGYRVALLSRSPNPGISLPVFHWNPEKGTLDNKALDYADCIIHLAGLNIGAKRWTPERKQQILESRLATGELIFQALEQRNVKPLAFITASAIGYYGAVSTETLFDESFPAGSDFLGQTCDKWEGIADRFSDTHVHNDLRKFRDRHDVLVPELFLERRQHFVLVFFRQYRHRILRFTAAS